MANDPTKSTGGSIPEETPAAAPTKPPAAASSGPKSAPAAPKATAARPAAPAEAPAAPSAAPAEPESYPEPPEGFSLFLNEAEVPVRFSLRDGENHEREFRCAPRRTVLVPKPYADIIPARAPQLRRVAG